MGIDIGNSSAELLTSLVYVPFYHGTPRMIIRNYCIYSVSQGAANFGVKASYCNNNALCARLLSDEQISVFAKVSGQIRLLVVYFCSRGRSKYRNQPSSFDVAAMWLLSVSRSAYVSAEARQARPCVQLAPRCRINCQPVIEAVALRILNAWWWISR